MPYFSLRLTIKPLKRLSFFLSLGLAFSSGADKTEISGTGGSKVSQGTTGENPNRCYSWIREWADQDSRSAETSLTGFVVEPTEQKYCRQSTNTYTVKKTFGSDRNFANYLNQKFNRSLGVANHFDFDQCTPQETAQPSNATAKYFFFLQQIQSKQSSFLSDAIAIDQLLNTQFSDETKCRHSNFPEVSKVCREAQKCKAGKNPDQRIKELSQLTEENLIKINLQRQKTKEENDQLHLLLQHPRASDSQTQQNLLKNIALRKFSIAQLVSLTPWIQGATFKSLYHQQTLPQAIEAQLRKNGDDAVKKFQHLEKAKDCLQGRAPKEVKCDEKLFLDLAEDTSDLDEQFPDQWLDKSAPSTEKLKNTLANLEMAAQSCLILGKRQQLQIVDQLEDLELELAVTGATGGFLLAPRMASRFARQAYIATKTSKKIELLSSLARRGLNWSMLAKEILQAREVCMKEVPAEKLENSEDPATRPKLCQIESALSVHQPSKKFVDCMISVAFLATGTGRLHRSEVTSGDISGLRDRRSGIQAGRLEPDAARSPQRQKVIDEFEKSEFTSREENVGWISHASDFKPDGKTKFLTFVNSVMKGLNDSTGDKPFVTALTNKAKQLHEKAIKEVLQAYPQVIRQKYSDYNPIRHTLEEHDVLQVPENLEAVVAAAFQKSNKEFRDFVVANKLVRNPDKSIDWFHAGMGDTAEEADRAARAARDLKGQNRLRMFKDPEVQSKIVGGFNKAKELRSQLSDRLKGTDLFEGIPDSQLDTLSEEVFALFRRSSSPEDFGRILSNRFKGIDFDPKLSSDLHAYAKLISEATPGNRIPERIVANLDEAAHGGFSADIQGLGSANLRATAEAMANAKDVNEALALARAGEVQVTERLNKSISSLKNTAEKPITKDLKIVAKCTGDDCNGVASRALTTPEKQNLLMQFAEDPSTARVRVAFIPAGIKNSLDRNLLSSHGEGIEKLLRARLEGQIPFQKSKDLVFGIDMKGQKVGQGGVELLIAPRPGTDLSVAELKKIRSAMKKAIDDYNRKMQKQGQETFYSSESTIRLSTPQL